MWQWGLKRKPCEERRATRSDHSGRKSGDPEGVAGIEQGVVRRGVPNVGGIVPPIFAEAADRRAGIKDGRSL
jgi:hypothetical protein